MEGITQEKNWWLNQAFYGYIMLYSRIQWDMTNNLSHGYVWKFCFSSFLNGRIFTLKNQVGFRGIPIFRLLPRFRGQRWETPKIMGWRENVMMKEITLNMYAGERFRSEGYNWYNILIISSGVWKRCVCIMADWIVMCSPPFWNERCPKGGNKWLWATRQLVNLHKTGHAARRVDILSCCIFRYQLLILWDKANTTPAFPQVVIDLWSPVSSLQSFLMTMLAMIYMISLFCISCEFCVRWYRDQ